MTGKSLKPWLFVSVVLNVFLLGGVGGGQTFIGTPAQVAEKMDHFVQSDGSDGFVLAPHLTPTGLDDFVDQVVPLLQERGVLRREYEHPTLRENLGLPAIVEKLVPASV